MSDMCLKCCVGCKAEIPGRRARPVPELLKELADRCLDILEGREDMQAFLAEREVWARDLSSGPWIVTCLCGRIWTTIEGDSRDYDIKAGSAIRLSGRGRLVIMGIGGRAAFTVSRLPH